MDQKESVHATALDKAIASNNVQILKTAIPYVTNDKQKFLSIYVKYLELMNSISYFKYGKESHGLGTAAVTNPDIFDLLQEIKAFLSKRDQELVDSFVNMAQMMRMYDSYKDIFNAGFSGDAGDAGDMNGNPLGALMGMLSPEQQAMFEMYQNML